MSSSGIFLISPRLSPLSNTAGQSENKMSGFITEPEVIANKQFIMENYGKDFFAACLEATGTTFLALLCKHGKI
jgi:hypothetical protein